MNILYPLGTGSTWNNNELRYSLRSLEFVSDFGRVFVVGFDPGFLSDAVTFIPAFHRFSNPATGIFANILHACQDKRLPERFLLMNDDYFFCSKVHTATYPYYHLWQIRDRLKNCSSEYYHHLFATQNELQKRNLPTLNFDSHYPMIVEKSKVLKLAEMYDWNREHGFTFKSIYCNTFGIQGDFRQDCKVNAPHPLEWWIDYAGQREVFSIGDSALNGGCLVEFLRQVFYQKSIFEK